MQSTFINAVPADFFEAIAFHPLAHRAGKYNVDSEQYYVLNFEDQFRGFKAAYGNGQLPFFLYHQEILDAAIRVFTKLFGHAPDLIRAFTNKEKTWNAFLVTSRQFAQFDYEPETNIYRNIFYERRRDWAAEKQLFRHFPVIGSFNDYAYGENPALFYLIATPFRETTASFLTVDNYRFLQDADKQPFAVPGANRAALLQAICEKTAKNFQKERDKFDKLLTHMAGHIIAQEHFSPVVLDLYNRNRNVESVRNDDTLQMSLRQLFQQAEDFCFGQASLLWSDFIHFIIRHNEFNLEDDWLLKRVEELFAEKRSYKKFNDVFAKFKNDHSRYERYVSDQVADWRRVSSVL